MQPVPISNTRYTTSSKFKNLVTYIDRNILKNVCVSYKNPKFFLFHNWFCCPCIQVATNFYQNFNFYHSGYHQFVYKITTVLLLSVIKAVMYYWQHRQKKRFLDFHFFFTNKNQKLAQPKYGFYFFIFYFFFSQSLFSGCVYFFYFLLLVLLHQY
jgi:hypothetical protein